MVTLCLQLPEPNKAKNLAVSVRTVSSLTVTWDAGEGENTGFTVQLDSGTEVPVTKGTTGTYTFNRFDTGQRVHCYCGNQEWRPDQYRSDWKLSNK